MARQDRQGPGAFRHCELVAVFVHQPLRDVDSRRLGGERRDEAGARALVVLESAGLDPGGLDVDVGDEPGVVGLSDEVPQQGEVSLPVVPGRVELLQIRPGAPRHIQALEEPTGLRVERADLTDLGEQLERALLVAETRVRHLAELLQDLDPLLARLGRLETLLQQRHVAAPVFMLGVQFLERRQRALVAGIHLEDPPPPAGRLVVAIQLVGGQVGKLQQHIEAVTTLHQLELALVGPVEMLAVVAPLVDGAQPLDHRDVRRVELEHPLEDANRVRLGADVIDIEVCDAVEEREQLRRILGDLDLATQHLHQLGVALPIFVPGSQIVERTHVRRRDADDALVGRDDHVLHREAVLILVERDQLEEQLDAPLVVGLGQRPHPPVQMVRQRVPSLGGGVERAQRLAGLRVSRLVVEQPPPRLDGLLGALERPLCDLGHLGGDHHALCRQILGVHRRVQLSQQRELAPGLVLTAEPAPVEGQRRQRAGVEHAQAPVDALGRVGVRQLGLEDACLLQEQRLLHCGVVRRAGRLAQHRRGGLPVVRSSELSRLVECWCCLPGRLVLVDQHSSGLLTALELREALEQLASEQLPGRDARVVELAQPCCDQLIRLVVGGDVHDRRRRLGRSVSGCISTSVGARLDVVALEVAQPLEGFVSNLSLPALLERLQHDLADVGPVDLCSGDQQRVGRVVDGGGAEEHVRMLDRARVGIRGPGAGDVPRDGVGLFLRSGPPPQVGGPHQQLGGVPMSPLGVSGQLLEADRERDGQIEGPVFRDLVEELAKCPHQIGMVAWFE